MSSLEKGEISDEMNKESMQRIPGLVERILSPDAPAKNTTECFFKLMIPFTGDIYLGNLLRNAEMSKDDKAAITFAFEFTKYTFLGTATYILLNS
jgi:hypothetical protein